MNTPALAPDAGSEQPPTFSEALRIWVRIGVLSFGGPAGQIALMHRLLVEEKRWISEKRFLGALNYCMLLPGPEAQQLAIYIGWLLHGLRGGLAAGILFVLPGFVLIVALSAAYALFQNAGWLTSLFFGLKAAVLAIVIEAVIRLGRRALRNRVLLAIAVLAFLSIFALGIPFPLLVLAAALAGWMGSRFRPELFAAPAATSAEMRDLVPDRAARSGDLGFLRAIRVIAFWGAIWVAPVLLLGLALGWHTIFLPIAAFFSKMAVVTFGGAYAVLSYVAQQAVESHGWLRPGEMVDGLALAETTPGPLILVLAFVGFLAAFRDPGLLSPLMAGLVGATLTTWVTFVPCFLWIFLGAPYIERLSNHRALSGALTAVTAAVVGVILNLALWFALHTLFRETMMVRTGPLALTLPVPGSLDGWAMLLAVLALIATFFFRLGMVKVLLLCALAGFLVAPFRIG